MDTLLVALLVVSAIAYLIVRKTRALKKLGRDWATGHANSCGHCPAIQIRQAQLRKLEMESRS